MLDLKDEDPNFFMSYRSPENNVYDKVFMLLRKYQNCINLVQINLGTQQFWTSFLFGEAKLPQLIPGNEIFSIDSVNFLAMNLTVVNHCFVFVLFM